MSMNRACPFCHGGDRRPHAGLLLIVMLPRPYAKWICAFAGGIATVASVGLAATFAGNGMNAVDVTWASMGRPSSWDSPSIA
ncbi:MAG: hypothetical protein ACLU37_04480 [Collinsella sp.]